MILHLGLRSSNWVRSWFTPQKKRLPNISSNLSPTQNVQSNRRNSAIKVSNWFHCLKRELNLNYSTMKIY